MIFMAEKKGIGKSYIYESFLSLDIDLRNYIFLCKNFGFSLQEKFITLDELRKNILKNKLDASLISCKEEVEFASRIGGIAGKKGEIELLLDELPSYSFVIWAGFELKQPYFSRDDEELYLINNPVLKDKAFKVPMIRGSGWKGNIASAFKGLINEAEDKKELIRSYFRILGSGSEYVKALEENFAELSKKSRKNIEDIKTYLRQWLLFELGLHLKKDMLDKIRNVKDENGIREVLREALGIMAEKEDELHKFAAEFKSQRGRAIFYPTFFDKIGREVINPHNRRRRAGNQPIFYEVVPERTEGIVQIAYIPFDAVLKKESEIKKEAVQDLEMLVKALERTANEGIGAKSKLGWGTFEFCPEEKYCFLKGWGDDSADASAEGGELKGWLVKKV